MEELTGPAVRRPAARSCAAAAAFLALLAALAPVDAAQAGLFKRGKGPAAAPASAQAGAVAQAVRLALDEDRLVDAGKLLDQAFASGAADPELVLLSGELHLAKGRNDSALRSFAAAEATPALAARAAEGRGLALAALNRSDDAMKALLTATAADPSLWRAWNALGVEYDRRKEWSSAEDAYRQALKSPRATAAVYCNQGYSLLLQGRYDESAQALVTALQKDPALAQARTNLRLALALRGDYGRATAVNASEDRAAVLNNAGYVAMLRGDLEQAESLFNQAIETRGRFYGRAYENLTLVRSLRAAPNAAAVPANANR